jgi:transcriptional regulator with XRE-family HTH domain
MVISTMKIGQRILSLRKKHELTQEAFGALLKMKKQTAMSQVCRWEKGKVIPSLPMIHRICKVFKVGIAYFL